MTAATPSEVRRRIDECLLLMDYVNAMWGLFLTRWTAMPSHGERFEMLLGWRRQVVAVENAPRQALLANAEAMLDGLRAIHADEEGKKWRWKTDPI